MLLEKLEELAESDIYPFHMPGHKRAMSFPNPYSVDITEIADFDNLHHAEGVIKKSQERAAGLYGSDKAYYLVNGSTCGILAAISAAALRGSSILIARNCHKAVYHALYLRQLKANYIYPKDTKSGIQGQIDPAQIESCLEENPLIKAIVITSPTYDGVVSDVEKIAEAAHRHNAVLIVDEAHGAHFGFHPVFPENATRLGADAVIMSVHKTLPSFTQTALLHLCSDRISTKEVEKFLNIYESSSPSYILMAGIEQSLAMIEEDGERLFKNYVENLKYFREKTEKLKHLRLLGRDDNEFFDFDIGKILIETGGSMSGHKLTQILRENYHLELEMAGVNYATAMTSIMDTREGFDRLAYALCEIDGKIIETGFNFTPRDIYRPGIKKMEIFEAEEQDHASILLNESEGRVCAAYVSLYPPGIPIIVPGEVIEAENIYNIQKCKDLGYEVNGADENIEIVK
jgi:arginine/lysine/ornithine decarboxylase